MMRKGLLFVFFLSGQLLAQTSADSLLLVQTGWKTSKIARGVKWQCFHFKEKQLFHSNQNLNLLKTNPNHKKIKVVLLSAGNELKLTSTLGKENKAMAGINGGFFDIKQGGSVDFIKINGKILDTTRRKPDEKYSQHRLAALTIHKNKVEIVKGSQNPSWEYQLQAENVLVTGPLMIFEGKSQDLADNPFNRNRHPRTCIGITHKKELILLTADGRNAQAEGLTLTELTFLMKILDCEYAVNLDGGGSTTMWLDGQVDEGVVNCPSDNKIFDHFGERKVSNGVFLFTK